MNRANIANPKFDYDTEDPEGFRAGMARFGPALGAKETGTSVYEIPAGEALCPYHYEAGEEEWLLVLEGNPTLREPGGETRLEPWDLVFFTTGPDGAHSVRNETDHTARLMMWSSVMHPGITVYPDSDKVGVWPGNDEDGMLLPRSAKVDYYHGEV